MAHCMHRWVWANRTGSRIVHNARPAICSSQMRLLSEASAGESLRKAYQKSMNTGDKLKAVIREDRNQTSINNQNEKNVLSEMSNSAPLKSNPTPKNPTQQGLKPPPMQGHFEEFAPKIAVVGVGGAGGNAVNNMIARGLSGVEFLVANTDAQHLATCLTDNRLQLGAALTRGLGCGANPEQGRLAAEESVDELLERIGHCHMVFITAGMGGGTGTGAAPVVADACLRAGLLTVGVLTKPFSFEGTHRTRLALEGVRQMEAAVDALLTVPNQNLFKLVGPQTPLAEAFRLADDVLLAGVRSVTDLMVAPGLINLDFADVRAVMSNMGNAIMGTGVAEGEDRALAAAEDALSNPLLGDLSVATAKGVLVNIAGGADMTLYEVDQAATRITEAINEEHANVIFGSCYDKSLEGKLRVSLVATGIEVASSSG